MNGDLENEFIPYHLALRFKALGFDEPCFGLFENKKLGFSFSFGDGQITPIVYRRNSKFVKNVLTDDCCTAPTFSQAFDFIEKILGIYVEIGIDRTTYPKYTYQYTQMMGDFKDLSQNNFEWGETIYASYLFKTKREAMIECLNEIIKK